MRLILFFLLLCPVARASGYCVPLTIAHAKVPNTDQTNLPLYVGGFGWMADTAHRGFAVVGNNGYDIRFYSNSGCTTALDFKRFYWTSTTGASAWRVRVPTASHTVDTTIYIKIGSGTDTTDASTNWMGSYGYIAFYAGGDPASVVATDSGSANLTLNCGAGVTAATSPIGGGFFFPTGATDTQTCGWAVSTTGDTLAAHGYPVGSTAGHIRYWFKNTSATSSGGTFDDVTPAAYGKANSSGQRGLETEYRTCQLNGLGETQFGTPGPGIVAYNNAGACSGSTTPLYTMDINTWHTFDFDQPTNGATYSATSVSFDAAKITSPAYWAATGASVINTSDSGCCTGQQSEIRLGRMAAHGAGWFTGYVAQFEVTNFSWTADYTTTRYNNESSPDTFYTVTTSFPTVAYGISEKGIRIQ